jgi:hypothetical protein
MQSRDFKNIWIQLQELEKFLLMFYTSPKIYHCISFLFCVMYTERKVAGDLAGRLNTSLYMSIISAPVN